jgi:hypothetical protein
MGKERQTRWSGLGNLASGRKTNSCKIQVKEVNENGKKEKGSGYTSDATEDRKPTHTDPLPESSSSIWRPVFYSFRRLIYAPKILNERGILKYGMA